MTEQERQAVEEFAKASTESKQLIISNSLGAEIKAYNDGKYNGIKLGAGFLSELRKSIETAGSITLQSETWPPEPKGTTTAGITSQLSEKSGQLNGLLIEEQSYLQKFRQGYTLNDIDATQTDASKTLDALIQRMQGLTSHAAKVVGLG